MEKIGSIHFIIGHRLWQGTAGLVTAILVVLLLSAEEQGWYFTFVSLVSIYTIFEMGLALTVVQIVARLFLKTRWQNNGDFQGEGRVELTHLIQAGFRVYLFLALVFIFSTLFLGWKVFGSASSHVLIVDKWHLPWLTLILFTAVNMCLLFFLAILEGSGDIKKTYQIRLYMAMGGSFLCWLVLLANGFLWATIAVPFFSTAYGLVWFYRHKPSILKAALKYDSGAMQYWNKNVWSLQWRVGLYWVSIFLMSQVATPILFMTKGSIIAGQMGLSLTIAHMIGIIAQGWIVRGIPTMTQAATNGDWTILDNIFTNNLRYSILTFILGCFCVVIVYLFAEYQGLLERLLAWPEMIGLMIFVFVYHINNSLAAQMRSFHQEPLCGIFFIGAILIVLTSLTLVSNFSVAGIILAMVIVQLCFIFPLSWKVWHNCNRKWRNEFNKKLIA